MQKDKLRAKGQFFTPDWVAEAMVAYAVKNNPAELFDPATGLGAFYTALKQLNSNIRFYGTDIDDHIIELGKQQHVYDDNAKTELRDFILNPPNRTFDSIIANPPYIRHHRLTRETKDACQAIAKKYLGHNIDARAGLHVFFLIQSLGLLAPNGRSAYLLPTDTVEGVFATDLWNWVSNKFCIDCVALFEPKATPFPQIDVNVIVIMIRNSKPQSHFVWAKVKSPSTDFSNFIQTENQYPTIETQKRLVTEAVSVGLSRPPMNDNSRYQLSDFAFVKRGIATGANHFFFLTEKQAHNIPKEFLKVAIGRTRDIEGDKITHQTIQLIKDKGRPHLLLSCDNRSFEELPNSLQRYIEIGEKEGLNKRPLIKTRNPWYKMEQRNPPDFLFAYLGRRNLRFIYNDIGVLPLTSFICVFANGDEDYKLRLFEALNHPDTLANLVWVAKSYGSGSLKVEPSQLSKLPIPNHLVKKFNLI